MLGQSMVFNSFKNELIVEYVIVGRSQVYRASLLITLRIAQAR